MQVFWFWKLRADTRCWRPSIDVLHTPAPTKTSELHSVLDVLHTTTTTPFAASSHG
jgi:hypothetical protein